MLVAGQRGRGGPGRARHRVADLGLADVLEPRRDVADLARHQLPDRDELRAEDAELERFGLDPAAHEPDRLAVADRSLREADVDDHALVGVVVAVEDQALQRSLGVALRRRDPRDDRLEDLGDTRPVLRRGEDDLLARDRQDVLELIDDRGRVGRGQVDLVEDRDQGEVLAHGEMDVRQRLRLDALGRIDHEDRALAGLQAVADLIGEVHVTGRVDEVEPVDEAVVRGVLEPGGAGLDRDALLALEVHRIEDLARHLPGIDRVGHLQQPVREGRLAVVDVGDDREVAEAVLRDRQASPRSVGAVGPWSC